MKAAAYIRVSTEAQADEDRFGLEAQKDTIETFAAREGIEITDWFIDPGVSGATLDRPGLQELLSAEAEAFDVVLMAKMDRVARDLMAQLWIEKELLRRGWELVSASEPFRGQDPANVLFRQIIGAFAQFEKARITERMSGGRRQKALRGGYAGGAPPMGYRAQRGSKVLRTDPKKAATVRRVFALRDAHRAWTLAQIAEALNREGHTTTQGKRFQPTQVKRILDNRPLYEGRYTYLDIEAGGRHEAILKGRQDRRHHPHPQGSPRRGP